MLIAIAATAIGCRGDKEPPTTKAPDVGASSVTLKLAVVNDAPLESALGLLRGEWSEQSGGRFEIVSITAAQLFSDDPPQADVVVFPSRWLGELCERGRLRPMRASVVESDEVMLSDLAAPIRERVIVYGGQTMALPLGCPAPLIMAPGGEEEKPPAAWTDIPDHSLRVVAGEAIADFGLAYALLARAACAVGDEGREGMLFDAETMAPRLSTPPFHRALEQLAAATAPDEESASMAILWPVRPDTAPGPWPSELAIAPLPGARETYDPVVDRWRAAEGPPQRVALLATSGALVGVTTDSRNAAAAFRLAGWLAGVQNARQLATASPSAARVRRSQSRLPDDWLGGGDAGTGRATAAALAETMSAERAFAVPAILRIDDYLAALQSAAEEAVSGRADAAEALRRASAAWAQLTESIGVERQRRAYLRSLGIERYDPPRA